MSRNQRLEHSVRTVIAALAAVSIASTASAQVTPLPPGLAILESDRSRLCVDVMATLDQLDIVLAPLAERAQRLAGIAEAVALEDDRIVEQLDLSDPIEAQVSAWFESDEELAQRYVATLAQELIDQRAAERESTRTALVEALEAVQAEANEQIAASDNAPARAAPCDGAIFVRSAVLEACETTSGLICEQAALAPSEVTGFRFVDTPEAVWDVSEIRPWTDPTPLGVTANGQLDGARTIAFARTGNVVVSVAFSPLLRDRTELTPEQVALYESTNDSLGLVFEHPDLAFVPALGVRATLPRALGDEDEYTLHFGPVENADVLWTGTPGSGAALESTVPLGASHVTRLQAGEIITFSALRSDPATEGEAVFTIELASVNQARASQALLGYMAQQLGLDVAELVRPRGSQ